MCQNNHYYSYFYRSGPRKTVVSGIVVLKLTFTFTPSPWRRHVIVIKLFPVIAVS